jgi:hypothetical protein
MTAAQPTYRYRVIAAGLERADWFPSEEEARGAIERLLGKHPDAEIEREERAGHGVRYCLKRQGLWLDSHYLRAGRSPEEILALDAKAEAREPVGPVTFIGTFQRWHYHPNTGQNLRGGHVEFQVASGDDANALMWYAFGDDGWYDAHPLHELREQFKSEGLTEAQIHARIWEAPAFRVSWPTPPRAAGETVTLRVRITEEQARKSELWIGMRCLLHRPGAKCPVQYGAGVWPEDGCYPAAWRASPEDERGIAGAGLVLNVKFFVRADAEAAVRADPENVSIVPGSESFGTFRRREKTLGEVLPPRKNRVVVTGLFTMENLESMASAEPAFSPIYDEACKAWQALELLDARSEARAFAVEIVENRVVAIHVEPPAGP